MGTRSLEEREAHWLEAPAAFLNVCHPALSGDKRDGLSKKGLGAPGRAPNRRSKQQVSQRALPASAITKV